jgi:polar amino acid transport system substrate-binding protein
LLPAPLLPPSRTGRRRWLLPAALASCTALAALAAPPAPARAESVVERVARTGDLVLVGDPDQAPLLFLDAQGNPVGYGAEVARRIQAELQTAVGRPVRLRFEAVSDPGAIGQRIVAGTADLACGQAFTWERDMLVDYSLPIGASGLRLLAPAGGLDGSPAGLAGSRIGVVAESLAATELAGFQPAAVAVPFSSLKAAVAALRAGEVAGVIGDSALLAGLAAAPGGPRLSLSPEEPYESYAVACIVPENDSAFRNLVNLAIARLLQGYLDGRPEDMAVFQRWIGPGSPLNRSPEQIRGFVESMLLSVEAIRPLPAGAPAAQTPATP